MSKEHTVTLNEGQIALIGLIFQNESRWYWDNIKKEQNVEDLIAEDPLDSATKLDVMAGIIEVLGIDDQGDLRNLAQDYRDLKQAVELMPDERKALVIKRWKSGKQ